MRAAASRARTAVLDGALVTLDAAGHPDFYGLLFRRAEPLFYVFDVLAVDGADVRARPTIERKRIVRKLIPGRSGRLRYFVG